MILMDFPATSLTHEHLFSVIRTEAEARGLHSFRVLDAGCGNGHLMAYLYESFQKLWPEKTIEFHGYDVADHGVQLDDFFKTTLKFLNEKAPSEKWKDQLHLIHQGEAWPFADRSFDFIISNQVLEHVNDRDLFFSEMKRCLKSHGKSVHLFPLKECVIDGHLMLPYVHHFKNRENLKKYIYGLSRLGFGKYWENVRDRKAQYSKKDLNEWSDKHADYMLELCNYMSFKELSKLAKSHDFDLDFSYTDQYYLRKLKQVLGGKRVFKYSSGHNRLDRAKLHFFKKLSSVTVGLSPKPS